MQDFTTTKPPSWYWLVAALALVWNLFGVMAYIAQVTMPAAISEAMTAAERAAVAAQPAWYVGAFAIAVFGGTLGCLLLLLRRRWAVWALALSLAAIIVQQLYYWVLTDVGAGMAGWELGISLLIPVVAALLLWIAVRADRHGWLK
ncbi:MAG: hypothetical protein GW859_06890 [Sphingomonadales bacterium]|nr:hypothetical protein [Sphingomonadales bacterium]